MHMSRTIRTERPWFADTRRFDETGLCSGRAIPAVRRTSNAPLTADGRFSDASAKGPARRRAARRVARQGHEVKATIISKAWYN